MREVVRKEVLKLLKAGVIYPISDSEWVNPVEVVSKKGGMMVTRNKKMKSFHSGLSPVGRFALITGSSTKILGKIISHYTSLMKY
jgi:hypothetical protein